MSAYVRLLRILLNVHTEISTDADRVKDGLQWSGLQYFLTSLSSIPVFEIWTQHGCVSGQSEICASSGTITAPERFLDHVMYHSQRQMLQISLCFNGLRLSKPSSILPRCWKGEVHVSAKLFPNSLELSKWIQPHRAILGHRQGTCSC